MTSSLHYIDRSSYPNGTVIIAPMSHTHDDHGLLLRPVLLIEHLLVAHLTWEVVCPFMCTHTAHAHTPVCGNANFARIRTCKLFYLCLLAFRSKLHVTLVAFAIWHSFLPRSDPIYPTVHTRSQIPQHESAGGGSANCGWIGSLSHTDQSDHNMHGTGHAARSHPFFVLATLKYLRISHFAKSSGRHVRVCACECLRV